MKPMGSFLPLELNRKNAEPINSRVQVFREYVDGGGICEAVNLARHGIARSIILEGKRRVYIPMYLCTAVEDTLQKYDMEIMFYHVDECFMPIITESMDAELSDGWAMLLIVNYFSLIPERYIDDCIDKYGSIVIDNTQAFYYKPNKRAYNVYSCRKFFGVTDGALLLYVSNEKIVKNCKNVCELPPDYSADRTYHCVSYEKGTDESFANYQRVEVELSSEPIKQMSALTKGVLAQVDFEWIASRRKDNYMALAKMLGGINELKADFSDNCMPQFYPLLYKKRSLHGELIKKRIYVAHLWKELKGRTLNANENDFVNFLIPLPIDQRYTVEDMEYMANLIKNIVEA